MDLALAELEVLGGSLHHVRREREQLRADVGRGTNDRAAGDDGRPARVRPRPSGRGAGVARRQLHVLDADAELVGGDLGEGRLVALAVVVGAARQRDRTVGLHRHARRVVELDREACELRALAPPRGRLDERADPDAEVAAFGAGLPLALPEAVIVERREGLVDALAVAAAVVVHSGHALERRIRNQVSQAQLDGIHPQPPSDVIDQRFSGNVPGSPANPAVRAYGASVRERAVNPVGDGAHVVERRQQLRGRPGRSASY